MIRFAALFLIVGLSACSREADPEAASSESAAPMETAATDPAPGLAASGIADRTSRYTSLKDCTVIEDGGGEDWSVSRCEGLGGYALQVNYFDARDSLSVMRDGKVTAEIELWLRGGGGFNSIGDTVEWRGAMQGGRFAPTTLIVRNNVFRDPEHPDRSSGVLEVVDLARGCSIGSVEPQPGQNEAARVIADGPQRPCLGKES